MYFQMHPHQEGSQWPWALHLLMTCHLQRIRCNVISSLIWCSLRDMWQKEIHSSGGLNSPILAPSPTKMAKEFHVEKILPPKMDECPLKRDHVLKGNFVFQPAFFKGSSLAFEGSTNKPIHKSTKRWSEGYNSAISSCEASSQWLLVFWSDFMGMIGWQMFLKETHGALKVDGEMYRWWLYIKSLIYRLNLNRYIWIGVYIWLQRH